MTYNADHERICPVCGKPHYPPDLNNYGFRRVVREKDQTITLYFCKWSCLRKWEADRTAKKPPARETVLKTGGEHCSDCRYCVKGKYGFIDCTVYCQATSLNRRACRRFKSKYEEQEEAKE